ncbi:MAG: hypothetical protein QOE31_927 [Solirubrobacteraceae bacterium]|nr:hypothetical protein [Solirubrobacteraceae bacterium]
MFWQRSKPDPRRVDFSGHFEKTAFAVGDYAVANTYNGTVIQQFAPGTAPRPTRRPSPQHRPPRDPVELLGRVAELARVDAARSSAATVGFHGPPGVGKTVLLAHVATGPAVAWPDGVLYANVGGRQLEDLLQWLFTVFWDTGAIVYAPGALQVGEYLAGLRALVVLDDVELDGADIERLLGSAQACGFALGAAQPSLGEASQALRGLDRGAAAGLFARALGRAVSPAEQAAVDAFVDAVDGLPGHVATGARLVRDGSCALGDLVREPAAALARRRLLALPADQQELLGLLAELAPAPVPSRLLGPGAQERLERLRAQGLVERHSPRYTLVAPLPAQLMRELAHMGPTELLARLADEPDRIDGADAPSIVAALAWGERAGEDEAVLRAARVLAPAMSRTGCTGAWAAVAQAGLTAARRMGRLADEALFLHEQGTRLGCLGDREPARVALTRARDIRRALPDDGAAAVTEHNLRELFGGGGGPGHGGGERGGGGTRPPAGIVAAALAALAAIVAGAIIVLGGSADDRRFAPIAKEVPRIVITSPIDGHTYPHGTPIRAQYRCSHARACMGGVRNRVPVNGRAGTHTFTVNATGANGARTASFVTYTVAARGTRAGARIVITSPIDGHSYPLGTPIRAVYECPGATSCTGGVRNRVPVDGRPGTHDFTVTATGARGAVKRSVTYSVVSHPSPNGPQISISSPIDGKTYDAGTDIPATYRCTGADSCTSDDDHDGLTDASPGPHTFTVKAVGAGGADRTLTATYTVSAPVEPLRVSASAEPHTDAAPTLRFDCAGGTPPLDCSATMNGSPTKPGAQIGCGEHPVVVQATDADGHTTQKPFSINGDACIR